MKRDLTKIFVDEIYTYHHKKNYPTNKIVCNHVDEIWCIDLADMTDYKLSNNKRIRQIFGIIDIFPKYTWCIPLKNKFGEKITKDFPKILTISKRSPLKIESDRGAEFYKNIFQNFLRRQNIHHYSRFTDKGPSKAERSLELRGIY